MKINFPPGWGQNKTSPIVVSYEDLDEFIEAVREAGFEIYYGLKEWAGFSNSYLYIYDGMLHGSKSISDTIGSTYRLDEVIEEDGNNESVQDLLSLL